MDDYYFDDWGTGSDYTGDNSYDWSSGSPSEYYTPEFVPTQPDYISPADFSGYSPSQLYFSDVAPGADISALLPGGDTYSGNIDDYSRALSALPTEASYLGINDPIMRTAVQETMATPSDANYMGYDPATRIALESGEGIVNPDGTVTTSEGTTDMFGNGLRMPRSGYNSEGLRGSIVRDIGKLGVQDDPLYGLRTGALDKYGMLGAGLDGNAGTGLLVNGAPSTIDSPYDARILGDERTLEDWAKNQNLSWQDYAKQSGLYDPYDIGTDLRFLLGNALPAAGYGGMGGTGKGAQLTPSALNDIIKQGGTSAGKGSSTDQGQKKESTFADKSSVVRSLGATAAMIAAALAKNNKAPGSTQGDIGSNMWNVARMNNRGRVNYAEGGLARIEKAYNDVMDMVRDWKASNTPNPRDLATYGSGMLQDSARSISGRQRQLDELERQAVEGKAAGGRLVNHRSGGQADQIPANLSGGEYVLDADVVSALGDGNTDNGAQKLDQMRQAVRQHKRSAPKGKIPPKAKSPLEYMKG